MEEAISRIITDLHIDNPRDPISEPTLLDLQTFLDNTFSTNDSDPMDRLYHYLSSKSISLSSLVFPISAAMDLGPTRHSLLASKVYLSLLLSPNAPVFTLFTPMSFLSLLRSIRRSLKHQSGNQVISEGPRSGSCTAPNRKRKGGARARGLKNCAQNSFSGDGNTKEGEFDFRALYSLLERLELVIGLIHLDRFPDSLKSLVQAMAEIPVMAVDFCGNLSNYNKLTNLCSRVFSEVLSPEHGDPANTGAEVLKSLSPLILGTKLQVRTFGLNFVTCKMTGLAKECDGVKKALVNFPRYLVQKAPEKSEPRAVAVESIMEIVKVMEFEFQIGFVEYVVKMTQGKANLRLLGVDLIQMLMMSLKDPFVENEEMEMNYPWGLKCLDALIDRCSDASAGIRSRALANLAQLVAFLSEDERNRSLLKKGMGFDNEKKEGRMIDLLRKRCMDEKAAVKKAALLLITKLTTLLGGVFDGGLLKIMGMACSDPLVSIRKAAISALSEAFRISSDESVTIEWLHSVPRLIADNESCIQEECENLFLELILDRVCRVGSSLSRNGSKIFNSNFKAQSLERDTESLFAGVLGILKEFCNGEVAPWVRKLCTNLGKKKRMKNIIAISLQNIIRTSESLWLCHSMPIENWRAPPGAWLLLSEVSIYLVKAINWEFLHHHWKLLDKYRREEFLSPLSQGGANEEEEGMELNFFAYGDSVCLLQTISNVSLELPPEPAADFAHNLLKRIEAFNMRSTEVNAHVKALRTLCKQKASNPDEADTLVQRWADQLLFKASQVMEKYISKNSETTTDDSFITPPRSGSRKGKMSAAKCKLSSQAVTAVYTIGSLVLACPSINTSTVIPLLHTVITSGNSDPKFKKLPGSAVSFKATAPSLYLQAWLTMGKICLADGKLAKSYIPLFVQEFEKSNCAPLRNNLVVMMADFCVRYTALVDCYISKITKCLRDPCELVRRQTFILLSRLLQRDYVKWRGVLFLRFLLSLVDESEKIRQLADFLFGNILKVKAPLLAYNSFVEAIFVLNDCQVNCGNSGSEGSRVDNRLFSIRGNDEKSRSKRMHIYVSLLKQMAPEHLLATFAKLCAEILAAASDGMLNIENTDGQSVLQDAFEILSCKEIRLPSNRGSSLESADIDDEGTDNGGAAAIARGKVITQAVRRGLIQNTIPIFIELKRLLESKNSPLIGSLMKCLLVILKDYKNEIDDILVADKQLQKELMYDMQKYESAKAKSTASETVANMERFSIYNSPEVAGNARGKNVQNLFGDNVQSNSRVASAIADVAAAATARCVLREVNKGASTPPLSSLSVPKLKKSGSGGTSSPGDRPLNVIESLRKKQSFESDEEN